MNNLIQSIKTKTIGLIALAVTIAVKAIACGGGDSTTATGSISPEVAVDYVHTVLLADRTAYTKHVVYPDRDILAREVRFYGLHPFAKAWILYGLAFVVILIVTLFESVEFYWGAIGIFIICCHYRSQTSRNFNN